MGPVPDDAVATPPWLVVVRGLLRVRLRQWMDSGHWLVMRDVEYLSKPSNELMVERGTLVLPVVKPANCKHEAPPRHWAVWYGRFPHNVDGKPVESITMCPKASIDADNPRVDGLLRTDVALALANVRVLSKEMPFPDNGSKAEYYASLVEYDVMRHRGEIA